MMNKLYKIFVILAIVINIFTPLAVLGVSNPQTDCPANSVSVNCQPPKISDIQVFIVQMIGTAWALGGILFGGILIYNGAIYLIGNWEESKYVLGASIEDVQKRMTQWGIGFFLFFLSYPIMNSFLKFLVGNSNCYDQLKVPGFTFVFSEVCAPVPPTTP